MSFRKSNFTGQNSALRIRKTSLILCAGIFLLVQHFSLGLASGKWSGVDETVVEKYAKDHGRESREPLLNTDQGDLLLFVFLLAGAAGGFVAGYSWRTLAERKPEKGSDRASPV